jgi:hypothetical protein
MSGQSPLLTAYYDGVRKSEEEAPPCLKKLVTTRFNN